MFKYVKFNRVPTEYTVLTFNQVGAHEEDELKINFFDKDVVSIEGEEAVLNELIKAQDAEIKCVEITKEEFRELVSDSAQIERCRDICKENIAKKYDLADEISMFRKADDDQKVLDYETYRNECIVGCTDLKAKLGY